MYETATVAVFEKISPELNSSLFVGVVYIILPILLLFVHLIFNMALHTKNDIRKLQAFRLMFYIGILDCIQLICHIYSGIVTIWPNTDSYLPYLSRIMGATINSAWVGLFPLSLIISLYRLLTIRKITNRTSEFQLLVKVGVLSTFTYCFVFFVCQLTFAQALYDPSRFSWSYTNEKGSVILALIEYIACMPFIICTFIIYIMIAATVLKMKYELNTIRRTDLHLIIHAAILFLVLTTLITFWHYHDFFFPNSIWTMFVINLYYIIYCGLNPILYLACSRKIRQSFLQFIAVPSKKQAIIAISIIGKKVNAISTSAYRFSFRYPQTF